MPLHHTLGAFQARQLIKPSPPAPCWLEPALPLSHPIWESTGSGPIGPDPDPVGALAHLQIPKSVGGQAGAPADDDHVPRSVPRLGHRDTVTLLVTSRPSQ